MTQQPEVNQEWLDFVGKLQAVRVEDLKQVRRSRRRRAFVGIFVAVSVWYTAASVFLLTVEAVMWLWRAL